MPYVRNEDRYRGNSGAAFLIMLIWMIPSSFIYGFTLMVLWNWFMPLIFVGIPQLTIGTALGLSIVIGYLTLKKTPDSDKDPIDEALSTIIFSLLACVFYLAFGWVVYSVIT